MHDVLEVREQGRSDVWSILWLFDVGGFEIIFWVGIVRVFPLILPSKIVGVSSPELDLVVLQFLGQLLGLACYSC